jgi:hypothetical protein
MNGKISERNGRPASRRWVAYGIAAASLAAVCAIRAAYLPQPAVAPLNSARDLPPPRTATRSFQSLADIARELGRVQAQGKGALGFTPGRLYTEDIGLVVFPAPEAGAARVSGFPLDVLAALLADRPDAPATKPPS